MLKKIVVVKFFVDCSIQFVHFLLLVYPFLDPLIRKRRKKTGGSGRKTFTEGWIEFKDRKIAKAVASSLNGTIIGT